MSCIPAAAPALLSATFAGWPQLVLRQVKKKHDVEYCGIVVNPIMAPCVAWFSLPLQW